MLVRIYIRARSDKKFVRATNLELEISERPLFCFWQCSSEIDQAVSKTWVPMSWSNTSSYVG